MDISAEVIEAIAYRAHVDGRIDTLRGYLRWFRANPGWIVQERVDTVSELRYLLRLRRQALALARPAVERADPVTSAGAYPAAALPPMSELELRAAYGDR